MAQMVLKCLWHILEILPHCSVLKPLLIPFFIIKVVRGNVYMFCYGYATDLELQMHHHQGYSF